MRRRQPDVEPEHLNETIEEVLRSVELHASYSTRTIIASSWLDDVLAITCTIDDQFDVTSLAAMLHEGAEMAAAAHAAVVTAVASQQWPPGAPRRLRGASHAAQ